MTDRVAEIRGRWARLFDTASGRYRSTYAADDALRAAPGDVAYLLAEVDHLRDLVAGLVEQPATRLPVILDDLLPG